MGGPIFLRAALIYILMFWGYTAYFFSNNGYFPYPFFLDIHDVAMDFYNVNYWTLGTEAYSKWGSVYSTMNLALANQFTTPECRNVADAFELRACNPYAVIVFTVIIAVVNSFLLFILLSGVRHRILWLSLMTLSFPMMYGMERGNYIQLGMMFISIYLLVERGLWQQIGLIGAILSKIYLVILLVPLLIRSKYKLITIICGSGLLLSFFFGWSLSINDWYLTVINVIGFNATVEQSWVVSIYAPTFLEAYKIFTGNVIGGLVYGVTAFLVFFLQIVLLVRLSFFVILWGKLKQANSQYLLLILLSVFLLFSSAPGFYALVLMYPFFAYFLSKSALTPLDQIIFMALLVPYPFRLLEITQESHFYLPLKNDLIYIPISLGWQTFVIPALLTALIFSLTSRIYLDEISHETPSN